MEEELFQIMSCVLRLACNVVLFGARGTGFMFTTYANVLKPCFVHVDCCYCYGKLDTFRVSLKSRFIPSDKIVSLQLQWQLLHW